MKNLRPFSRYLISLLSNKGPAKPMQSLNTCKKKCVFSVAMLTKITRKLNVPSRVQGENMAIHKHQRLTRKVMDLSYCWTLEVASFSTDSHNM